MSYEKQLNITTEQLIELENRGVLVGKLAYAGFKFDTDSSKTLDKQLDDFCDHCDSDECDDITFAAETGDSWGAEMEAIESEKLAIDYFYTR